MKEEMRNFLGPRRIIIYNNGGVVLNQSPSGRLLVLEPDYLHDLKILFQPCLDPSS